MRLLIIEDEERLVEAMAKGLRRDGYAVDIALDGESGCAAATVDDYDLLILDLNLPDLDGLEVCRRVRGYQPKLPILILTARTKPSERVAGLDQGADDYLFKPFYLSELAARVRALLRRGQDSRAPALAFGPLWLDPAGHVATCTGRRLTLTGKEFAVLEYFLRHKGEVVSAEDLLEHVWDREANPFSTTVSAHLTTLRRALAQSGGDGCIETVTGVGYRLRLPSEQAEASDVGTG